jgi:hypothetical protein
MRERVIEVKLFYETLFELNNQLCNLKYHYLLLAIIYMELRMGLSSIEFVI